MLKEPLGAYPRKYRHKGEADDGKERPREPSEEITYVRPPEGTPLAELSKTLFPEGPIDIYVPSPAWPGSRRAVPFDRY
jgi:hypothetical protein